MAPVPPLASIAPRSRQLNRLPIRRRVAGSIATVSGCADICGRTARSAVSPTTPVISPMMTMPVAMPIRQTLHGCICVGAHGVRGCCGLGRLGRMAPHPPIPDLPGLTRNSEVRQFRDCHPRGSPDHRHLRGYLRLLTLVEPPQRSWQVFRRGGKPCRKTVAYIFIAKNPPDNQFVTLIILFYHKFAGSLHKG